MVTIDFFSGDLDRLIFLASSLYLAYIPLNVLKRLLAKYPFLFTILSNTIRVLFIALVFVANVLVGIKDVVTFQGWGATEIKITTSLVKFNTFTDGQYEDKNEEITLGFFEDGKDSTVAETVSFITILSCCSQFLSIFIDFGLSFHFFVCRLSKKTWPFWNLLDPSLISSCVDFSV